MAGIFLALDGLKADEIIDIVQPIKPYLAGLKIGLELYLDAGKAGYRLIESIGLPIFLDLKLHDIPNTVDGAIQAIGELNPFYLTLHAVGGHDMMVCACEARQKYCPGTKLLGVTVLTSLDDCDLSATGIARNSKDQVQALASLAQQAGLDGVICSPKEIKTLRAGLGPDFHLVTPGIRPRGVDAGDQKRVMTPREAAQAGATALVIGRAILKSRNPVQAAASIVQEIQAV